MWVHPGQLPKLCADDRVRAGGDRVRAGGDRAAAPLSEGLSRTPVCDLCVARSEVKKIVSEYRLRPAPDGQVRLHAVAEGVPYDSGSARTRGARGSGR